MTSFNVVPKAFFGLLTIAALTLPIITQGFSPATLLQGRRLKLDSRLGSSRSTYNHDEEKSTSDNNINNGNIPTALAMDRRSFGTTLGGIALSSLLLSSPLEDYTANAAEAAGKTKRILITGSNSGIGMDAAMRMAMKGHEVVLACVSRHNMQYAYAFGIVFVFILETIKDLSHILSVNQLSIPFVMFKMPKIRKNHNYNNLHKIQQNILRMEIIQI